MIYNKHELLLKSDENVRKAIPGIEHGKEYWVYSYIIKKVKKEPKIVYDITPRKVTAKVIDDCCYVISTSEGYRFSMFSAYGRQLYFADTQLEAAKGYNRLVNKINKLYDLC